MAKEIIRPCAALVGLAGSQMLPSSRADVPPVNAPSVFPSSRVDTFDNGSNQVQLWREPQRIRLSRRLQ